MKKYFVTGIDTEIGKTVISAILTEALQADYWKPIQSGDLENSDSHTIRRLISNTKTHIHQEAYRLKTPASPHYAAQLDNVTIDLNSIKMPHTTNNLIVEGAGGLMVPLNRNDLMIDLIEKLQLPVILVSKNYLGSINHTLLSIKLLQNRNIKLKGIIFNGPTVPSTEDIILHHAQVPCLGYVGVENIIDKSKILQYAKKFVQTIH
ncbi:MAG: dethiobiotin synthase [Chitinophagales bacterium]